MLPQRSKHPREMVITPKASTSSYSAIPHAFACFLETPREQLPTRPRIVCQSWDDKDHPRVNPRAGTTDVIHSRSRLYITAQSQGAVAAQPPTRSIYLSIDRSIDRSICLSIYLSICLSIVLFIYLSLHFFVFNLYISTYLSFYLSLFIYIYFFFYLYLCMHE